MNIKGSMKPKNQWIDETMNSLDGIKTVPFSEDLVDEILIKAKSMDTEKFRLRTALLWRVAATILILISLNIITSLFPGNEKNNTLNSATTGYEYLDYLTPVNF